MRKTASGSGLTVSVTRFNEATKVVSIEEGQTVADVLNAAGISLSSSETVWCNGETAGLSDQPEAGDILSIVGKKEGGIK
jgi:membrane-bound inhibitor of C-type lysozyme